jgi:hypothetical protein
MSLLVGLACLACGRVGFEQAPSDGGARDAGSMDAGARDASFDAGTDAGSDAGPPPPGMIQVPLVVYALSNDDGTRAASITAARMQSWVDRANSIYASAGINFEWDGTITNERNTALNSISDESGAAWAAQMAAGNAVADRTPTAIPILVRFGNAGTSTGVSFSSAKYRFVVAASFDSAQSCGHQDLDRLARDLGFQLGLTTTYPAAYASLAAAQAAYDADNLVFEHDELGDTAPDPFVDTAMYRCMSTASITISGRSFPLPRSNLMSLYDAPKLLSELQTFRVRQGALVRTNQDVRRIIDGITLAPIEGESLAPTAMSNTFAPNVQADMSTTFLGRWSADSQFFWAGGAAGSFADVIISVASAGTYRIVGMFTVAPDFGIFRVSRGATMGPELHLYARTVTLSRPLDIGTFTLGAGNNTLRFEAIGLDPGATRGAMGFDYLLLERQ